MNIIEWFKSKPYWIKGAIIGFIISVIIEIFLVYFIGRSVLCIEPLNCADYVKMFMGAFIFFAPMGLLLGAIIGLIVDKIKSK